MPIARIAIATAALALTAPSNAQVQAASPNVRYVQCYAKYRSNVIITHVIPFTEMEEFDKINNEWIYIKSEEYGISPADANRTGFLDSWCYTYNTLASAEQYARNNAEPTWKWIEISVAELANAPPQTTPAATAGAPLSGSLIIEDAEPYGASAAEVAALRLKSQQQLAAKMAKAVAEGLRHEAEMKAKLAQIAEADRRRGRAQ